MIASAMIYGAKADCMHINIECNSLGIIKETFVHEYQHYIHASYQYDGKSNRTVLDVDEKYIDEGFSKAAEMLLTSNESRLRSSIRSPHPDRLPREPALSGGCAAEAHSEEDPSPRD